MRTTVIFWNYSDVVQYFLFNTTFPVGEQRCVQFRTDFFSAFNHPPFSAGQTQAVTASTYGQLTSESGARVNQMSLQI